MFTGHPNAKLTHFVFFSMSYLIPNRNGVNLKVVIQNIPSDYSPGVKYSAVLTALSDFSSPHP